MQAEESMQLFLIYIWPAGLLLATDYSPQLLLLPNRNVICVSDGNEIQ